MTGAGYSVHCCFETRLHSMMGEVSGPSWAILSSLVSFRARARMCGLEEGDSEVTTKQVKK